MATCMTWTHHNFLACVCTLCWGKRHEAARSMKMDKTMYQHLALIQKFSMLHTYWSIFSAEWFQVKEVIFIIHISKGTPTCSDTWYHTVHDPYQAKKLLFLWIARVWCYTKEPTDTTRNGTSPGLKEKLCNSAGQKLDWEVSLGHSNNNNNSFWSPARISQKGPWIRHCNATEHAQFIKILPCQHNNNNEPRTRITFCAATWPET